MASVLETVTAVAPDAGAVDALQGRLREVPGRASLPSGDIARLSDLAAGLRLPSTDALVGDSPGRLGGLVAGGLPSVDALLAPLTGGLDELERALEGGVGAAQAGAFGAWRTMLDGLPPEGADLLVALRGPLERLAALLLERPELQRLHELVAKVEEIRAQLAAAPQALATLISETTRAAIREGTALLDDTLGQVRRFLDDLLPLLAPGDLAARLEAALFRLVPVGGPSAAEIAAAVDLADESAALLLDAQIATARIELSGLAEELTAGLSQAGELIATFAVPAWAARTASAAELAASGAVNDLAAALARWRETLREARELVGELALDGVLAPVRELRDRLMSALGTVAAEGLGGSLGAAVTELSGVLDRLEGAELTVVGGARSAATAVADVLASVDLAGVSAGIDGTLAALDAQVAEIEGVTDGIATSLGTALTALRDELAALRTDLTDPAGSVRGPFESFLAQMRDAIPPDLPERLAEVGETVETAAAGLGEVTFDPVFDEVVAQLEDMRRSLDEIDPASLESILLDALRIALSVVVDIDFEAEVEKVLVTEFDELVATVSEPQIQLLQDQVDAILDHLRANGPAELFARLGIEAAYDEMVAGLEAVRPSEALREPLERLRQAAEVLDGFTPARALEPLLAPLAELRRLTEGLSLQPVLARLDPVLGRLGSEVGRLDVSGFADELSVTVTRVRERLAATLDTQGLLEGLRPLHTAVTEAVAAVDPAVVVAPLTEARQVILDAIDAVDTDALATALAAVATIVEELSLDGIRSDLIGRVDALGDGVAALDLPGRVRSLREAQAALIAALEARGVQADAVAEDRRQLLLATTRGLDPMVILAAPLKRLTAAQAGLADLRRGIDQALRPGGPLEGPLDALARRLREVALGAGEGAGGPKAALRDAVIQGFAAIGVEEVVGIHAELRETVDSYRPEALEAALEELLLPPREALLALVDPATVLGPAVDAFAAVRTRVDPGLRDFVRRLADEVQPVLDEVKETVAALDPTAAIQAVGQSHAALVAVKDRLLAKLDALLAGVDAPYAEMVGLVEDLNPAVVLIEPLDATYREALARVEGVRVRAVFEPVLAAIADLRDQLMAGIERVAEAFRAFLRAAPAGTVSAGASV